MERVRLGDLVVNMYRAVYELENGKRHESCTQTIAEPLLEKFRETIGGLLEEKQDWVSVDQPGGGNVLFPSSRIVSVMIRMLDHNEYGRS